VNNHTKSPYLFGPPCTHVQRITSLQLEDPMPRNKQIRNKSNKRKIQNNLELIGYQAQNEVNADTALFVNLI